MEKPNDSVIRINQEIHRFLVKLTLDNDDNATDLMFALNISYATYVVGYVMTRKHCGVCEDYSSKKVFNHLRDCLIALEEGRDEYLKSQENKNL